VLGRSDVDAGAEQRVILEESFDAEGGVGWGVGWGHARRRLRWPSCRRGSARKVRRHARCWPCILVQRGGDDDGLAGVRPLPFGVALDKRCNLGRQFPQLPCHLCLALLRRQQQLPHLAKRTRRFLFIAGCVGSPISY
jgi:hypothetical protein